METAVEKGEEPVTVFSKKQTAGGPKADKVKRKPSAFNIFMQKVCQASATSKNVVCRHYPRDALQPAHEPGCLQVRHFLFIAEMRANEGVWNIGSKQLGKQQSVSSSHPFDMWPDRQLMTLLTCPETSVVNPVGFFDERSSSSSLHCLLHPLC